MTLVWLFSHSYLICILGYNRNSIELALIWVGGLDGEERYFGRQEKSILYDIYFTHHFPSVSSDSALLQIPTFLQKEKLCIPTLPPTTSFMCLTFLQILCALAHESPSERVSNSRKNTQPLRDRAEVQIPICITPKPAT